MSASLRELSMEERVFILSKTYQSIPMYFAHWQDADIGPRDLDARYQAFLPKAIAARDRREFALVMGEFMSVLNNGHTGYHDQELRNNVTDFGFKVRFHNGEWVVYETVVDELKPGDLIEEIEDRSMQSWYEEMRKYTCMKSEVAHTWAMYKWLTWAIRNNEVNITYRNRDDERRHVTVCRDALPRVTPVQETEGRWLESGTAYVKIPGFHDPKFENRALEYVQEFHEAERLVVDVRGNGGGSTPEKLIKALMNRPWRQTTASTPLTIGLMKFYNTVGYGDDFYHNPMLTFTWPSVPAEEGAYNGKLIILIDRHTYSAAEDFTIPFKDNRRAVIVGEQSGGSTGQPFYFDFGDGIDIRLSTKRETMPDGSVFEGVGITSDVYVPLIRQDYYAGHDPVLAWVTGESASSVPAAK